MSASPAKLQEEDPQDGGKRPDDEDLVSVLADQLLKESKKHVGRRRAASNGMRRIGETANLFIY